MMDMYNIPVPAKLPYGLNSGIGSSDQVEPEE
jgi:hypothetical protein